VPPAAPCSSLILFLLAQAPRETPAAARPAERVVIKAAHLIDGRSDSTRDGLAVLARATVSRKVVRRPSCSSGGQVIDLGMLAPARPDRRVHTHLLLQGDITAADYVSSCSRRASPTALARAGRPGSRHERSPRFATWAPEGAMYADADLTDAILARASSWSATVRLSVRSRWPPRDVSVTGLFWERRVPEAS